MSVICADNVLCYQWLCWQSLVVELLCVHSCATQIYYVQILCGTLIFLIQFFLYWIAEIRQVCSRNLLSYFRSSRIVRAVTVFVGDLRLHKVIPLSIAFIWFEKITIGFTYLVTS